MGKGKMSKEKFRLSGKALLAVILAAVILLGSVAGAVILSLQPDPAVNDQTVAGSGTAGGGDDQYNGASAEVSDSVTVLTAEEAAAVNSSISNVDITNRGLYVEIADGTAMDGLGIGDIFFLNGSESTPLGEPYFGKVTSKTDRGATDMYCIEAPAIDEVFDKLDIEHTEAVNASGISEIKTVEGVTFKAVDSLDSYFADSADAHNDGKVTTLSASAEGGQALALGGVDRDGKNSFVFECEIDLLEAFKLKKDDKKEDKYKESYVAQEGERVKVYVAENGTRYHRETCQYVKKSRIEKTLTAVTTEGTAPCKSCDPPVMEKDEGVLKGDAGITFEGKFGIEALEYTIDYNWNVLNGDGLRDLSVTTSGKFVAEAALKANAEVELGGRTTTISLPGGCVKFEGLKEKMFPLAFIGYNGSVSVAMGNEQIRAQTSAVPITIAFIFYADLSGKLEVGAEVFFNYSRDFDFTHNIVQNGSFTPFSSDLEWGDDEMEFGFKAEASGDVDFHVGASVGLYVFNLNVVDLALAKIGAEAQGSLTLALTNKTVPTGENIFNYDFYMRGYLKLLELRVNIKISFDIWALEGGLNLQDTFTALDHTLFQLGKTNPTRYSSDLMSYTSVTASDPGAIYYKDTDGKLIREVDGKKTTLYTDGFFSICGIDETFIYLTVKNSDGKLDVYRVTKNGPGGERRILDNVKMCLTNDEKYLYYTSEFDDSIIYRLDRSDITESQFSDFDDTVSFMGKADGGFYVVVGRNDMLSMLFGGSMEYYLLNSNGEVVKEYGQNPDVTDYYLAKKGDYYQASKMVSAGYLRNTAAEVYWLSEDKTQSVLTDKLTGWNGQSVGIFTTLNNDTAGEGRYKIVLYRAEDGAQVNVTAVDNDHAFFTLCETDSGDWYFFDQNSEGLTLYSMDADFQNKTAIKSFTFDEFPCDLENCSMTLMDGRLYFYTISDSLESTMLYRYDLG